MEESTDASMLAEGLSGIAVARLGALLEVPKAYARAAFRSAPTVNVSPLLIHLEHVVEEVLQAAMGGEGQNIASFATKIKSLIFALASSVGTARLGDQEDGLWQLSTKLWVGSAPEKTWLYPCQAKIRYFFFLHTMGQEVPLFLKAFF
jgi:hypothetical protein